MATRGKNGSGSSTRQPARRPAGTVPSRAATSQKVFRRRRTVALVLILIFLAMLVAGGVALNALLRADAPEAPPVPAVSAAAPEPLTDPGTPASAVCNEAGIKVSGAADKASYGPTENPVLSLVVTNTGAASCDINVGTSQMEFLITSGEDIIFNSKDCLVEPSDLVKNLKPGAAETANFTWQRNRSATGCPAVEGTPGGGGATYVFVATLGKWSSDKVIFQLQ